MHNLSVEKVVCSMIVVLGSCMVIMLQGYRIVYPLWSGFQLEVRDYFSQNLSIQISEIFLPFWDSGLKFNRVMIILWVWNEGGTTWVVMRREDGSQRLS